MSRVDGEPGDGVGASLPRLSERVPFPSPDNENPQITREPMEGDPTIALLYTIPRRRTLPPSGEPIPQVPVAAVRAYEKTREWQIKYRRLLNSDAQAAVIDNAKLFGAHSWLMRTGQR